MTIAMNRFLGMTLALAAGAATMLCSEKISFTQPGSMISTADAIIGRPLTPMSYAGVARRTTRRAVVGGAMVGAAVAASVVVAPGCVQVVNAYGQVVWQCP